MLQLRPLGSNVPPKWLIDTGDELVGVVTHNFFSARRPVADDERAERWERESIAMTETHHVCSVQCVALGAISPGRHLYMGRIIVCVFR